MALHLYNYLSGEKEQFKPLYNGFAGMYVCGPTVYDHAHIGHAKAYITFDLLHRYLEYLRYRVLYVQNITDVGHLLEDCDEGEDKIESRAKKEKMQPMEIVEYYTRSYFEDMDALAVIRPDISPRASAHIPEQIELAKVLVDNGYAYESAGSVFFSVDKWKSYGKLSGKRIEDLKEGARIKADSAKRSPRDFAVWRAVSPNYLMRWKSPWGKGIPGWHAECTAMAKKYLGFPFDIHGGGLENIFPHNESELAQCEAAFGKEYACYWVLNNMVTVNGVKMGKSLGNSVTIKDIMKKHSPMHIRFFILSGHYRSNIDFSDTALSAAGKGYSRLIGFLKELSFLYLQKGAGYADKASNDLIELIQTYKNKFLEAMDDDLNTPKALAVLFGLSKEIKIRMSEYNDFSSHDLKAVINFYLEAGGGILGIIRNTDISNKTSSEKLLSLILEIRKDARKRKDWNTADIIREKLSGLGIILEDGKDGTVMKSTM